MDKVSLSTQIKIEAEKLGFSACGIAQANALTTDAAYLKSWLESGKHGSMQYMERHIEKRTDPRLLVENTKSLVVVLLNYYPEKKQEEKFPQLAKFAYGDDYHDIIKVKLYALLEKINSLCYPEKVCGRAFTDSAPILERQWARQAGLGWIGKNGNLIHPTFGSFCFIGELLIDISLSYDIPMENHCGKCNKCLSACPTNAINENQSIDATKCISYLTIEHKQPIPKQFHAKLTNQLFGCDCCQDVCPWNKKAVATTVQEFFPSKGLLTLTSNDWIALSEEQFAQLLPFSPIKRSGYKKITDTAVLLHRYSSNRS